MIMTKVYWFEFRTKLAIWIAWQPRQIFEKWDKVLVGIDDKLRLLRVGARLIWEKDLSFDDVFSDLKEEVKTEEVKAKPAPAKPTTPVKPAPAKSATPAKKPNPKVEATSQEATPLQGETSPQGETSTPPVPVG